MRLERKGGRRNSRRNQEQDGDGDGDLVETVAATLEFPIQALKQRGWLADTGEGRERPKAMWNQGWGRQAEPRKAASISLCTGGKKEIPPLIDI